MNPIRLFLLALLILPVTEIYLLVKAGAVLGFPLTLLLIVGTGLFGIHLFRAQGIATWSRLQASLARGETPTRELIEGPLLLLGGVLLLLPGFLTDVLGLICLWPVSRRKLADALIARGLLVTPAGFAHPRRGGNALEGEFRRED